MSRSYKHNPIAKGRSPRYNREVKREANRRVRHFQAEITAKGNFYRRLYPQWDVVDVRCYWPWSWARTKDERYMNDIHYAWYRDIHAEHMQKSGGRRRSWERHWYRK